MEALRQRKRVDPAKLTGPNHPTTAFVVMGHGFEGTTNKQVVPEGCILVVQVHSGEINYSQKDSKIVIYNDPEKDKYLDPIANYKYILDKINSVRGYYTPFAIFLEGDEYPEFYYLLLSSWDQTDSFMLRESGVAQYPFVEGPGFQKTVQKGIPAKETFLNLYNKSIYPPRAELEQAIDTITEPKTLENIISSPQTKEKLEIKQSELFKKLGKGVYYNLVCRQTKDSSSVLRLDQNVNRFVINNNIRSLVNSSGHIRKNRPEILQEIVEAEGQRQGLIGKLNKNSATNTPPEMTVDEILHRIEVLSKVDYTTNIEMNYAVIKYLNNKYYPILKEYYLDQISQTKNPVLFKKMVRLLGQNKAEEEIAADIKKFTDALAKLEKFQPKPAKERVKNEEHELLLQKQMAEQRGAHARALNKAAQNEADFQMAALYQGLNQPAVPVQLVENNKNGFKQRQELAERQAQEAVGKWTRKTTAGGKRTRRIKKKSTKLRRHKKSPHFSRYRKLDGRSQGSATGK